MFTRLLPVARRRLVDILIQHLRDEIANGSLAPGTRIPPETQLTTQLGVSRTTLREAVVVLSHDGLLDVRQGDGTYVTERPLARESLEQRLSRAAALEVYEVRRPLELEAARLAAMRRTNQEVQELRYLLATRAAALRVGDTVQAVDADVAFRVAVAAASRNSVLADLYRTLVQVLRVTLIDVASDDTLSANAPDPRNTLADAIAARDPDAAARAGARLLDIDAELLQRLTVVRSEAAPLPSPSSPSSPSPPSPPSPPSSDARRGPRAKHARVREQQLDPGIGSDIS